MLGKLPKANLEPLYEFLLRENNTLQTLLFSVSGSDVHLSFIIFQDDLNKDESAAAFKNLFENSLKYSRVVTEHLCVKITIGNGTHLESSGCN